MRRTFEHLNDGIWRRFLRRSAKPSPEKEAPGEAGGEMPMMSSHLVGMPIPEVQLAFVSFVGVIPVKPSRRGLFVVFFFHDEDGLRVRDWAEQEGALKALGCTSVGISAQSPVTQASFTWTEALENKKLLSDSEFKMADALGLPTAPVAGERAYEPLTSLVRDGHIVRVFYPVDPARELDCVISWIKGQRNG